MRGGERGVQISPINSRGRPDITVRKECDFLSIQHGEKTWRVRIAARSSKSNGLDFRPDQTRGAILQCRSTKIERMVVCQAHGMKSGAAEQLRRGCWSAECIVFR